MIEHIQALSTLGKLDAILYEVLQTRHELAQVTQKAIQKSPLEETKGQIVDIIV
ncbi:hypothetical protein [Thermospira aquatica]|uniref:Chorismate mutase n=1 Tax=Thermospira aquatica TaxID=2828656 RepID=A0AAX3BG21_9SPIR|nr:hypothetical protein [Thermospira aquatica]URA11282.1 hypothetical protein KDW03_05660 [Thermospira aquatica]